MNKIVYVISVYDQYEAIWLPYPKVFTSKGTAEDCATGEELREKLTIITDCELVTD